MLSLSICSAAPNWGLQFGQGSCQYQSKAGKASAWTKREFATFTCKLNVFLSLIPLKDALPKLLKVIRIAMTIAVNTAHCEQSFSKKD